VRIISKCRASRHPAPLPVLILAWAAISVLPAAAALAQSGGTIGTRDIRVTATRAEESIFDVPMTVNVITSEEIERQPYSNIVDILANVPGLENEETGHEGYGTARIGIRGEAVQRTLILIDGVRVQSGKAHETGSAAGMPFITADQIERIEVIKGPASVLYGPEAIGGAINIITKKGGGDKPLTFGLRGNWDSNTEGHNLTASLFGRTGGFNYRAGATTMKAHGRRIGHNNTLPVTATGRSASRSNAVYDNRYYIAQLGYDWDGNSINVTFDRYENSSDIQESRNFPLNERDGLTASLSLRNLAPNLARLQVTSSLQALKAVTSWNYGLGNETNKHRAWQTTVQTDWVLGSHFVIAGVDLVLDDVSKDWALSPSYPGYGTSAKPGSVEAEMLTLGIFAQDEWSFADGWRLIFGARNTWVDGKTTGSTGRLGPITALPRDNSRKDSRFVVNAGVVFTGIEDVALRANWSQGYRYPTMTQLFTAHSSGRGNAGDGITYPNPNLKPETSNNFEIGARMAKGGFTGDLAVFYSMAKNYIVSEDNCWEVGLICTNPDDNTYANRDEANTYGVELQLAYTFFDLRLTPYLNATHIHREEVTDGTKNKFTGVPPLRGRVGLRWDADLGESFTLYTDLYSNWSFQNRSSATDVAPEWATANLTVGVAGGTGHKYDVSLNLRNITDELYSLRRSSSYAYGRQIILSAGVEW
jgi:hemoglobin/transferrin/lactoferrin receptor protein